MGVIGRIGRMHLRTALLPLCVGRDGERPHRARLLSLHKDALLAHLRDLRLPFFASVVACILGFARSVIDLLNEIRVHGSAAGDDIRLAVVV